MVMTGMMAGVAGMVMTGMTAGRAGMVMTGGRAGMVMEWSGRRFLLGMALLLSAAMRDILMVESRCLSLEAGNTGEGTLLLCCH